MLGDVKTVVIGVAVILVVLTTPLALVGWMLGKGGDTLSAATAMVADRDSISSRPKNQPKETHVTASPDDVKWRKYDGSV